MQVYITDAWSERDLRAVHYLEDEVFRREMRINLPEFRVPRGAAMLPALRSSAEACRFQVERNRDRVRR